MMTPRTSLSLIVVTGIVVGGYILFRPEPGGTERLPVPPVATGVEVAEILESSLGGDKPLLPEILEWCSDNGILAERYPFNYAHQGHDGDRGAELAHARQMLEYIDMLSAHGLSWPRLTVSGADYILEQNVRSHEQHALNALLVDPEKAVDLLSRQIQSEEEKYAMRQWRKELNKVAAHDGVPLALGQQALEDLPTRYVGSAVTEMIMVDRSPALFELCMEHMDTMPDKYRLPAYVALLNLPDFDPQKQTRVTTILAAKLDLDGRLTDVDWEGAVSDYLLRSEFPQH